MIIMRVFVVREEGAEAVRKTVGFPFSSASFLLIMYFDLVVSATYFWKIYTQLLFLSALH